MTEIGNGGYVYDFDGDDTKNYYALIDGGSDTLDARYMNAWSESAGEINQSLGIETGRWKIDETTNQMILYDPSGTILVAFDLLDGLGHPASTEVYERVPSLPRGLANLLCGFVVNHP